MTAKPTISVEQIEIIRNQIRASDYKDFLKERIDQLCDLALQSLHPASASADSATRRVPVEPTEKMLLRFLQVAPDHLLTPASYKRAVAGYKAMLAAAPREGEMKVAPRKAILDEPCAITKETLAYVAGTAPASGDLVKRLDVRAKYLKDLALYTEPLQRSVIQADEELIREAAAELSRLTVANAELGSLCDERFNEIAQLSRRQPSEETGKAVAYIEHHKGGDNLQWDRIDHPYAKATPLYTHPALSRAGSEDVIDYACICHGNWRQIIREERERIGKIFVDEKGNEWRFFGVVHGDDDYYYGMSRKGELRLLSCVGSIEGFDYALRSEQSKGRR